jgi:hypothetical protein
LWETKQLRRNVMYMESYEVADGGWEF